MILKFSFDDITLILMYLSLSDVNKFPRLDAILKDILILVRSNNNIFKEIDDYTGNGTDTLISALTYGLPPRVNPYMRSEIYERRATIIKTEGGITTSTPTRTSTSTYMMLY